MLLKVVDSVLLTETEGVVVSSFVCVVDGDVVVIGVVVMVVVSSFVDGVLMTGLTGFSVTVVPGVSVGAAVEDVVIGGGLVFLVGGVLGVVGVVVSMGTEG